MHPVGERTRGLRDSGGTVDADRRKRTDDSTDIPKWNSADG